MATGLTIMMIIPLHLALMFTLLKPKPGANTEEKQTCSLLYMCNTKSKYCF